MGVRIMSNRLEEIQKMFDEMGLGCPENRRRFTELAGERFYTKAPKEQLFIRLRGNALEAGESTKGDDG